MKLQMTSRVTCALLLLALLSSCGNSDTVVNSAETTAETNTSDTAIETEDLYPAELLNH